MSDATSNTDACVPTHPPSALSGSTHIALASVANAPPPTARRATKEALARAGSSSYPTGMRTVGIQELNKHFHEYLRLVTAGEIVLITQHDNVIASLGPPPTYHAGGPQPANLALERLARTGLVRMGRGAMPSASEPAWPAPTDPIDLPAALEALRAERFGG